MSTIVSSHPLAAGSESRSGMADLWRLWRNESDDPESFYGVLAERAVTDLERWFGPLDDQHIADLGCGPGWYTEALRAVGARVTPIDHDSSELERNGRRLEGAVVGDAMNLPVPDGRVRRSVCLQHARAHPRTASGDHRDRACSAARGMGLRVVDELVLSVGWPRHDPVPFPRPAARAASIPPPPRQPAEVRLRRIAVAVSTSGRRCVSSARAPSSRCRRRAALLALAEGDRRRPDPARARDLELRRAAAQVVPGHR